ncbi:hypothetical protein [Tunturiibacter gelidiferens]|uniref:Uncharacterized protein n=1 Tax=Tunturiibacter gelidiferens TaxID=3069689 RepID=A0AAU7YZ22_9BACT
MAPKLHPPVLSVKIHQNHTRPKINSKIVAHFFAPLKTHSKDHIHHANHHDLTTNSPHHSGLFPRTPSKKSEKDEKPPHGPYQDFFRRKRRNQPLIQPLGLPIKTQKRSRSHLTKRRQRRYAKVSIHDAGTNLGS